jgi:hypothetical protein
MHTNKISIWCGITAEMITGPIFFERTVDTAAYLCIFYKSVEQLDNTDLNQVCFKQDKATCHMDLQRLSKVFPKTKSFQRTCGPLDCQM